LSIAEIIRHEKCANRLRRLTVNGRTVQTFHTQAEGRNYVLNIVPPKTRSIWNVPKPKGQWWGDHRQTTPEEWNLWRDEMKRLGLWPPPTRGATNTGSTRRNRKQTGTPDAPKGARPVWEGLHGNQDSKEA
jgi:hypothetical protein